MIPGCGHDVRSHHNLSRNIVAIPFIFHQFHGILGNASPKRARKERHSAPVSQPGFNHQKCWPNQEHVELKHRKN